MIKAKSAFFKMLTLILMFAALLLLADALRIYAKASLAQILLEQSWNETLQDGLDHKPWSWADTWPIGRLQIYRGKQVIHDDFVLFGSTGQSLAFGPGHVSASRMPGDKGTIIIGGHRDTHFKRVGELLPGDLIRLQDRTGAWREFRFAFAEIVSVAERPLSFDLSDDRLLLVTCYPLDALGSDGDERWLLAALPETCHHLNCIDS